MPKYIIIYNTNSDCDFWKAYSENGVILKFDSTIIAEGKIRKLRKQYSNKKFCICEVSK